MAAYTSKEHGEVEAVQLERDISFKSGFNGVKGDWLVRMSDGKQVLCANADFVKMFSQVFPRPAQDTGAKAETPRRPLPLPPIDGGAA